MNLHIKIKRGLDIPIIGKATPSSTLEYIPTKTIAITPDDFPGITPKPEIKIGDRVKSGTPIIYDKNHPEIKITSPISGTITDIIRGERRKIEHIIISSEANNHYECLNKTIRDRDNAKDFCSHRDYGLRYVKDHTTLYQRPMSHQETFLSQHLTHLPLPPILIII